MPRYLSLSSYLRHRYGERVQKIPLDAGLDCPNRDGTISRKGCVFCNPRGSGTGLLDQGLDLAAQWEYWRGRMARKYKARLFWAYLQSFTNTHCTLGRLEAMLDEISPLPGLAGACIGTRPDCLDPEKCAVLARFHEQGAAKMPNFMTWLDLGLQSANDQTLSRINRGHDAACFARAAHMAREYGLSVCAHVIAGLPGEDGEDLLATVEFVNSLPIQGIKFHNLYVCENTALAGLWRKDRYTPPARADYVDWLALALARLRPDIVVHRLASDPAFGELLAPDWADDKTTTLKLLADALEKQDIRQGCRCGSRT